MTGWQRTGFNPSMRSRSGRQFSYSALIAALALLLRIWHLIDLQGTPWFTVLQMDPLYHARWATDLLESGWAYPDPFFRAPLYPYLLAVLKEFTGELLWSARLVQIALGVATVVLAHRIALRILPRPWAAAAGIGTALIWTPIFFEGQLLLEPPFTFMTTLLLYLMVREGIRTTRPLPLLAWGFLGGLAAITRPNILLFLPLIPLFASGSLRLRNLCRPALLTAIGILIPILPVWIHNVRQGDPAVTIAWQGGINLYIGNNPASTGWAAIAPGMRTDWQGGYLDAIRLAKEAQGRDLKPSEVSAHWTRQAVQWWIEDPAAAVRLTGMKALLFWSRTEIKNNSDPRFHKADRWSLRWNPVSFGLLAPFALVGLVIACRRGGAARLLAVFTVVWFISIIPFFICARYRLPITPFMPLLALLAVHQGRTWLAGGRRMIAAVCILIVALLYLLLIPPRAGVDAGGFFQEYTNLGDAYAQLNRPDKAETAYQSSIELNPGYVSNYNNRGLVLERLGRREEAEQSYREGLAIAPHHPLLRMNLALVLEMQDRIREALEVADGLYRDNPQDWNSGFILQRLQRKSDDIEGAVRTGVEVLKKSPRAVPVRVQTARLMAESGDTLAARGLIDEGLRLHPRQADLHRAARALGGSSRQAN